MKKYYYIGVATLWATVAVANNFTVEKIQSEEQVQQLFSLYPQYYQRGEIDTHAFSERWESVVSHPHYHMQGAFQDNELVGFMDWSGFPSLYSVPLRARIESIYVKPAYEKEEKEIFSTLFDNAVEDWKQQEIKMVICDSGDVYNQERRLFETKMDLANTNHLFYYKPGVVDKEEKEGEYAVREIKNQEDIASLAPLYEKYHLREAVNGEDFVERYNTVKSSDNYHMFGAWRGEKLVGFLDYAQFPTFYSPPSMARIDSTYIIPEEEGNETALFNQLFYNAEQQWLQNNVKRVIADSGADYKQEIRLFNTAMLYRPENVLFYYQVK